MLPKIFIISGPSGSGKTTIIKKIKKILPDLKTGITYTTRAERKSLVEDKVMRHISEKKFKDKIRKKEFAEWAFANGNYYGTETASLQRLIKKNNVILNIESIGAFQIKKKYPDDTILIFIQAESMKESMRRAIHRQKLNPTELSARKEKTRQELKASKKYDFTILNKRGELDTAVGKILKIMKTC